MSSSRSRSPEPASAIACCSRRYMAFPAAVSMGIGGVLVSLAAAVAALTVVPVTLAFWGPKIVARRADGEDQHAQRLLRHRPPHHERPLVLGDEGGVFVA